MEEFEIRVSRHGFDPKRIDFAVIMTDRPTFPSARIVTPEGAQTLMEGQMIEPTGHLSIEKAQALMDNLWECGLRPAAAAGSAGAMAAVDRHLNDMREIVSKQLHVEFQD